ncbi:MAG TPA: hypothetical protein VFY87_04325 [Geminicoccaceae bacterium]|nr:hypothetical protein [Geminicoccaceae bacterium]
MPFLTRYPAPALVAAALAFGASAAQAGECPPEHKLAQPRELTAPPDVGTMRQVLTSVDMSGWRKVDGLALRMRRLVVAKDGFVPLHYHNDRPSIVYVVSGEIVEHATFCGVPILHKAGEWTPEFGDFMGHRWENRSGAEVVLISTDVVPLENVNF